MFKRLALQEGEAFLDMLRMQQLLNRCNSTAARTYNPTAARMYPNDATKPNTHKRKNSVVQGPPTTKRLPTISTALPKPRLVPGASESRLANPAALLKPHLVPEASEVRLANPAALLKPHLVPEAPESRLANPAALPIPETSLKGLDRPSFGQDIPSASSTTLQHYGISNTDILLRHLNHSHHPHMPH